VPDAILLAGGALPDTPSKAFLDAAGRPLIWHVAQALDRAASVGRVAAVGPPREIGEACGALVEAIVPEAGSIMDNVVAGLRALPPASRVLVAASDIPLLEPESVEEFLDASTKEEADFYYAIVPQSSLEDRYPGARKTFVRVVDGSFAGGSVMLFDPAVVDRVRGFVEKVLAARKKPWLLAGLFGWSTVMKFASGRLSIREMEERAREVTGIVSRAVILRRPDVALDADLEKPENLAIIRQELGRVRA
jgi:GTP:adenosylcobinamide-phosphate guanylyltransferase